MTPQETTELLKIASGFDRRTISADDIRIWCAALTSAGIGYDEAVQAMVGHYTTRPDDYLQIGHIVAGVRAERSRRLQHVAEAQRQALARLDPDAPDYTRQALDAIRSATRTVSTGSTSATVWALEATPTDRATRETSRAQAARDHMRAEIARRGYGARHRADRDGGPASAAVQAARERARAERGTRT